MEPTRRATSGDHGHGNGHGHGTRLDDNARLALLATVVESCPDAIISQGLDGCITTWSRAAERIYGYTPRRRSSAPRSPR